MEREQDDEELASIPDPERRARLARFLQRRGKPGPDDVRELRELFPDIMRVYRRRVRTQLRTRGLSVPEIDDLAQEIFFGLHLSLKSSFPESVGALLYTITRRRVVDHLRTMGKEPYSLGLPSSASEPPKTPQDPGRALDGEAGRLWVLSQLTEEEKAILEAVDLDEMKVEDAAIALDIPLGTFKRHLGLARKKLAGLLQELQARGGEAA